VDELRPADGVPDIRAVLGGSRQVVQVTDRHKRQVDGQDHGRAGKDRDEHGVPQ
jgi:hypothetical protein